MRINGFEGISLIDYPGKVSSIVYTSPCNFKCPFCHNPSLVGVNEEILGVDEVINDISERAGFIEGVTISGGEPLLQDDLGLFIGILKKMGLKVKLDTNGYLPENLEKLIDKNLLDYIAMDIKTSPERYQFACGVKVDMARIKNSVSLIRGSGVPYEFRTTVVPGLVEEEDMARIGEMISGAELFSVQQFRNDRTYDELYKKVVPYGEEKLSSFAEIMKQYVKKVKILNTAELA
jgi:pyruvate formate lyase activating enzyme